MIDDPMNPGGGALPDMSPSERKLWSASHNLPPQYMLVTVKEMLLMRGHMNAESERAQAFKRTFDRIEAALKDYWKGESDMPNGVAAAVFEGKKWRNVHHLLLPHLRKAVKALDAVRAMVAPHVGIATMQEIGDLDKNLKEAVELIETQAALRRERKAS